MGISKRFAFGTLVLCALLGCQAPSTSFSTADLEAAEAEVAATLDEFWSAWEAVRVDEGMAFYSDGPDMSLITDGYLWESKAAVDEAYRPYFESLERQEINFAESHLVALTPEVVHVSQTGTYQHFSQSGEVSREFGFAASLLWVKRNGDWECMSYHLSEANPAPAALKSVHLFDVPSSVSEADFVGGLKALNDAIRAAGFEGNGYELWKISDSQDPEETPVGFDFVMHGTWVDQPSYDQIHELEVYQNTPQEIVDVITPVFVAQRYSRYVRVPTGGPGEGL